MLLKNSKIFQPVKLFLSLFLCASLVLNQVFVPVVLAQEETASPSENLPENSIGNSQSVQNSTDQPQDFSPSPTPSPDDPSTTNSANTNPETTPTATPVPDQDSTPVLPTANSPSNSDSTVEPTITPTPAPTDQPTLSLAQEDPQTNNPSLDLNENKATPEGNFQPENKDQNPLDLITGDATSGAQVVNEVNTNVASSSADALNLTLDQEPVVEPVVDPQNQDSQTDSSKNQSDDSSQNNPPPTQTGELKIESATDLLGQPNSFPEPTPKVIIINQNKADTDNKIETKANTGENKCTGGDPTTVITGDAFASVDLLNLLNANLLDSHMTLMILDIDGGEEEINLNELWQQIQNSNDKDIAFLVGDSRPGIRIIFKNSNQAKLVNEIVVIANTGDNFISDSGKTNLQTGDALALANVANFVNLNLLNSQAFFGIINIKGNYSGNLILPRPEDFSNQNSGIGGVSFNNVNLAEVNNQTFISANTGENTIQGTGSQNKLSTGDATALANIYDFSNLNLTNQQWYQVFLNLLGEWQGQTFGWTAPDAKEENNQSVQTYTVADQPKEPEDQIQTSKENNSVLFQNQNSAQVENNISVIANTGGNQVFGSSGENTVTTGQAKSLLNLFNFINLNLLSSRWFLPLLNILGKWTGNLIVAYPDLTLALTTDSSFVYPGNQLSYLLSFTNQGYEEAKDVVIQMAFPPQVHYLSDDSNLPVSCSQNLCQWNLGNLARNQGGKFSITVQVDENFLNQEPTVSFLDKLIPKVLAEEEIATFTVQAIISNDLPELDNQNNLAEKPVGVKPLPAITSDSDPDSQESNLPDNRLPILEITAKNNANEFVYLGDTVTFEVMVENKGEVPAYNAVFTQKLYNTVPGDLGQITIPLGTINPGKRKLTFGLYLKENSNLQPGNYHTLAHIQAKSATGLPVESNQARTDFQIKLKNFSLLYQPVLASEPPEEKVLGTENYCPPPKEKILPYFLLFALSSYLLIEKTRRLSKLFTKER